LANLRARAAISATTSVHAVEQPGFPLANLSAWAQPRYAFAVLLHAAQVLAPIKASLVLAIPCAGHTLCCHTVCWSYSVLNIHVTQLHRRQITAVQNTWQRYDRIAWLPVGKDQSGSCRISRTGVVTVRVPGLCRQGSAGSCRISRGRLVTVSFYAWQSRQQEHKFNRMHCYRAVQDAGIMLQCRQVTANTLLQFTYIHIGSEIEHDLVCNQGASLKDRQGEAVLLG
jgi:hypothetical protein